MADDTIQLTLTKAEHRTLRNWVRILTAGDMVGVERGSMAHDEAKAIHRKLRANATLEE